MKLPKQDIRVTKTNKALAEAMLKMLEKRPFQKITVNEICQEAMVSRSTFYLHFEDKYQLLSFCLQLEKERLQNGAAGESLRAFLKDMLSNVMERQQVYRNLFLADMNFEMIRMFQMHIQIIFKDVLTESEKQGAELDGPVPLLAVYYSHGLAGLIVWWIENNFHFSVDEIAQCQYNLLSRILPE